MRKALIICILAISITLMVNVKAYADDEPTATPTATPTPAPRVTSLIPPGNGSGGRISVGTIFDYYNNVLTNDQKQIADYLIGMYNYMYMGARGFIYEGVSTTTDLINRLRTFGNRFWGTTLEGNASRLDSYMQQFLSAIVSYAGIIDSSFGTWVDSISDSGIVIPYTKDSLNSWTNYYNDPSALGVEDWGRYQSDWVSGSFYDLAFSGFPFDSESSQTYYNNFILNNSPVIYTNEVLFDSRRTQWAISLNISKVPDSVFILRSQTDVYQNFRFGYSDISYISTATQLSNAYLRIYRDKLQAYSSDAPRLRNNVINNYSGSLQDVIQYAFNITPIRLYYNSQDINCNGYYPYINHVYLVDNLTTLENPQEIFNTTDFGINGSNAIWINEPNDDDLYWQIEPTLVQGDEWDENIVHVDLTPIDDDDLVRNVVNNTVINNFDIVAPGVQINVPVNWFDSEGNYLDYTYQYSLPFFAFIGDFFLTLGELRIFVLGGIILLLVGGVIGKFLL